jgi:hypothetical protein
VYVGVTLVEAGYSPGCRQEVKKDICVVITLIERAIRLVVAYLRLRGGGGSAVVAGENGRGW